MATAFTVTSDFTSDDVRKGVVIMEEGSVAVFHAVVIELQTADVV